MSIDLPVVLRKTVYALRVSLASLQRSCRHYIGFGNIIASLQVFLGFICSDHVLATI